MNKCNICYSIKCRLFVTIYDANMSKELFMQYTSGLRMFAELRKLQSSGSIRGHDIDNRMQENMGIVFTRRKKYGSITHYQ